MKTIGFLAIIALLMLLPMCSQMAGPLQVSAEPHADGQYYLVISGDANQIAQICALGNCQQGFPDRVSALNYFTVLLERSWGVEIAPIPQVATGRPTRIPCDPGPCPPSRTPTATRNSPDRTSTPFHCDPAACTPTITPTLFKGA